MRTGPSQNKVIGEREAAACLEKGGVEILHAQITVLNLDKMRVEVAQDRFTVIVTEAPLVRARDFAARVFQLLSHTPIAQLGMNVGTVFRARDRQSWDAMGDALAPKAPWKRLLATESKEHPGGLLNLTMERSKRADGRRGFVRVTVAVADLDRLDTKVDYNDHYELEDGAAGAVATLESWDTTEKHAAEIVASIRELAHAV